MIYAAASVVISSSVLLSVTADSDVSHIAGRIRVLCVAHMLLISTFAARMIDVFGWATNLGNAWYAAVFAGQIILLRYFGISEARRTVVSCYTAMILWAMMLSLLDYMPSLPGDPIAILAHRGVRTEVAAFIAFAAGQITMIHLWCRLLLRSFVLRYFVAWIVAQAVDSLVFFPIAFVGQSAWLEIMLVGFAFKTVLAVLFLPVVMLVDLRPIPVSTCASCIRGGTGIGDQKC